MTVEQPHTEMKVILFIDVLKRGSMGAAIILRLHYFVLGVVRVPPSSLVGGPTSTGVSVHFF